jgi:hypothetical protein
MLREFLDRLSYDVRERRFGDMLAERSRESVWLVAENASRTIVWPDIALFSHEGVSAQGQ